MKLTKAISQIFKLAASVAIGITAANLIDEKIRKHHQAKELESLNSSEDDEDDWPGDGDPEYSEWLKHRKEELDKMTAEERKACEEATRYSMNVAINNLYTPPWMQPQFGLATPPIPRWDMGQWRNVNLVDPFENLAKQTPKTEPEENKDPKEEENHEHEDESSEDN